VLSETSMRPMIVVAMAGVFWGGMASTALAQRSEAGDRGVRLENDALRTDVRRKRLERVGNPAAHGQGTQKPAQLEAFRQQRLSAAGFGLAGGPACHQAIAREQARKRPLRP
jgi:hypothetical protein